MVERQESTPVEVKRFTDEARESLAREGFVIYTLSGKTIRELRNQNGELVVDNLESPYDPYWLWTPNLPSLYKNEPSWYEETASYYDRKRRKYEHDSPQLEILEAKVSMNSDVAIRPDTFFLPESNNKTRNQQKHAISKYSNALARKIKGVKAIMGELPDYVELVLAHEAATRVHLFDSTLSDYRIKKAITNTPTFDRNFAVVGRHPMRVDFFARHRCGDKNEDVYAAPIVVPTEPGLARRLAKKTMWTRGSAASEIDNRHISRQVRRRLERLQKKKGKI